MLHIPTPISALSAADIPALLDAAGAAFCPIACCNWPADYPYAPEAAFRVAATPDGLLIHYRVGERTVRARYGADNQRQWTDSCVECFIIPFADDTYYNIECNCIGRILFCAGPGRHDREPAPAAALAMVKRWASLGTEPFEERREQTAWQVALAVPYAAFFKHPGQQPAPVLRANFYKCGDELQTPHFLSWQPIPIAAPDFHRPEFFAPIAR